MSLEIVMPQMGESITEGTVSKWLKKIGETVEKDEAILEISTDKVDAEVPSSGSGVLLEIRHQEGETVEVGTVLAIVGEAGGNVVEIQIPDSKVQILEPEVAPVVVETISNSITPANSGTATEIVMPQMGESITEGTVSKWLKKVGDDVEKDEAILEISTDKVDAEVPSAVSGKLLEILYQEGETVEVGTVLAFVGSGVASPQTQVKSESFIVETPKIESPQVVTKLQVATVSNGNATVDELRRSKSSPLVRNIAKEHGIEISRVSGTGMSGRVTKTDILSFIDSGAALRPEDLLIKPVVSSPITQKLAAVPSQIAPPIQVGDRIEPMSNMRKKISEHMTFSKQTSAHVTSVYEFDMTNVAKFREANKSEFLIRYGTKLSYMPFIFQAVTAALREFPIVNSQVDGDKIIYKGDVNLGMAVALDWGLIVPVIKKADQLSLSGLAITANDLADRARTKKLSPDEVNGGTFTITNPGVFGGLFGTPIINQPQVAILCVGTIEKRPKVLTTPDGDDYIAVRSMAYFALTYDHRVVDGSDAEKFLSFMKKYLETTAFNM